MPNSQDIFLRLHDEASYAWACFGTVLPSMCLESLLGFLPLIWDGTPSVNDDFIGVLVQRYGTGQQQRGLNIILSTYARVLVEGFTMNRE